MFEENIKKPLEILEEYMKYEFLLNVDKKELYEQLFANKELKEATGNPKVDLNTIRKTINTYHISAEEILNLSNDYIETPMFRVQAEKLKKKLS